MVKVSVPSNSNEVAFWPLTNTKGATPIPTKLLLWMRSKLSAITAFTPNKNVPFAAQSLEEPEPYSLPAKIIKGVLVFWYSIAVS